MKATASAAVIGERAFRRPLVAAFRGFGLVAGAAAGERVMARRYGCGRAAIKGLPDAQSALI